MVKKQRALTRFQCGHCANRLVMHNRHLGQLVACHACGQATHPVANRLASVRAAAAVGASAARAKPMSPSASRQSSPPARDCANCGQAIGKLQVTERWREQTVCQGCHAKLAAEAASCSRPASHRPQRIQAAAQDARLTPKPALVTLSALTVAPTVPAITHSRRVAPSPPKRFPMLELSAARLLPSLFLLIVAVVSGFFLALSAMSYLGGFVSALLLVVLAAAGVRWLRRAASSVRNSFEHLSAVRRRYGSPRAAVMLTAWLRSQPPARLPYALFLLLFGATLYVPYCLSSFLILTRPALPERLAA